MKALKEEIKTKVKSKAKALKERLKGSKKGAAAALALAALLAGCSTADPASRSNDTKVGDVTPSVKVTFENSSSNTVHVTVKTTLGDGVIASADSKGSTETQTATPTTSIPVRIDARYNDAIAGASATSKGILESLTQTGMEKVLALMQSGGSGTVAVEKADGTQAVVKCEDGQCTECKDCELK